MAAAKDGEIKKAKAEGAAGHNWSEVTYTWSDDNKKVTATRVCRNDPSHVEFRPIPENTPYPAPTPAAVKTLTVNVKTVNAAALDKAVRTAGNANYKAATKTITLKIKAK